MKKVAAIGLLFVFLFNIIGYKFFFYSLEKAADVRLEARLETLPDADKELITVKIPINLPYQTNWKEFERIDGEVTFKGATYKYVKRKVYQDTLILLCINDKEKTTIQKNSIEYFKKVNDLNADANKKPTVKQAKNDYFEQMVKTKVNLFASYLQTYTSYQEALFPSNFIRKIKMPPRQALV